MVYSSKKTTSGTKDAKTPKYVVEKKVQKPAIAAGKKNQQKITFEKSCGIVLFSQQKTSQKTGAKIDAKNERYYLLLHYPGGHWDFPKGHVEDGENETQTAHREMLEETGIARIKLTPDFRKKIGYFYRRDRKLYHKDVVFFLGETSQQEVKLSHEHQGYAWLPYIQAINQLTFPDAKKLLKKAENFLRQSKN